MSTTRTWLILATAGALLLAAAACQDSETIAPDGSTISLTANPAQVILVGGIQDNPVTVLATVRNSIGVPLPGQDVRFTTTYGQLAPPAGTPVSTDDIGNATSVLTLATSGPQITATSGKATASLTLNSGTSQIAFITLDPNSVDLVSCGDTFDYTAKAVGSTGTGVANVTIEFHFIDTGAGFVSGIFQPSIGTTDANGELTTTLNIDDNVCGDQCVGNGKICNTRINATGLGGATPSNESIINDQLQ